MRGWGASGAGGQPFAVRHLIESQERRLGRGRGGGGGAGGASGAGGHALEPFTFSHPEEEDTV